MPRGIARKLVIYLTLMVILVEGVFAVFEIRAQRKHLLQDMVLNAEMVAQTMLSTTWHAMLEDERESVYQMMEGVGDQENIDKVRIFNKAGHIVFSSGMDEGQVVDIRAEACYLCHAEDQPLVHVDVPSRMRTYRLPDDRRVMGMVAPVYNEPSCSTAACHAHPAETHVLGVIDVTMPLDRFDAQMAEMQGRSVALAVVSVLVVAFFVVLFSRRFVQQPVWKLIEATKAVGTPESGPPLEIVAKDELGELARSFRVMQDRIIESNREIREFTDTLERRVEKKAARLREAEQKLIQSDRLASLGQLSASVAHEINNPLAGVINFSKLMQRIIEDGQLPPERMDDFRSYLEHVVNETVRCGNIVRDLLVFARHSSPSRARHDVNEIVQRTLSVINHRLELGEVTPELDLATDLPEVMCDASQIQQIVINLVLNGAEAMEVGTVMIRTRHIADCGLVRLEVEDTGTGITAENLKKIYDPFFSTKEEGQGTGLGLAVVYGIVEAHHGQIDVDTREGRGTRFSITLPVDAPADVVEPGLPPDGFGS